MLSAQLYSKGKMMDIKLVKSRVLKTIKTLGNKERFLVCKQKDQAPRPWVNGIHLPFAVRQEDCKNFHATGIQFLVELRKRAFSIYLVAQDFFLLIYK